MLQLSFRSLIRSWSPAIGLAVQTMSPRQRKVQVASTPDRDAEQVVASTKSPRSRRKADEAGEAACTSPPASQRLKRKAAASTTVKPTGSEGDAGSSIPRPKRKGSSAATANPPEATAAPEGEAAAAKGKHTKRAKKEEAPKPKYDESMRPPPTEKPATRLLSWNVAGLRAVLKKDPAAFSKLVQRENCDIICIQEIKISDEHVDGLEAALGLEGWHATWNCSTAKKGYSGVATLSREQPLSVSLGIEHNLDGEGRVLMTEHPGFYLVNAYVPNSGPQLERLSIRTDEWDPQLSKYCKELEAKGKPVVLTGDLNCAHKEIDIHSPKTNLKSAGFTPQERASFQAVYIDQGFVDTFRAQVGPDVVGYTYFSHRVPNVRERFMGWRLDYFLVSSALAPRCHDSFVLVDVPGSDHVPLGLVLTS